MAAHYVPTWPGITSLLTGRDGYMHLNMTENEISRIFNNNEFGYWSITVERPLRLRVFPDKYIPVDTFKNDEEYLTVTRILANLPQNIVLDDWAEFSKATKLKAALLKKIRPFITEVDPSAKAIDEADPDLRDTEIVPFTYAGGISEFMKNEVLLFAEDAWVNDKKTVIGYEVSFTKYFYKPVDLRAMEDIIADISLLEQETAGLLEEIIGGNK